VHVHSFPEFRRPGTDHSFFKPFVGKIGILLSEGKWGGGGWFVKWPALSGAVQFFSAGGFGGDHHLEYSVAEGGSDTSEASYKRPGSMAVTDTEVQTGLKVIDLLRERNMIDEGEHAELTEKIRIKDTLVLASLRLYEVHRSAERLVAEIKQPLIESPASHMRSPLSYSHALRCVLASLKYLRTPHPKP
jgi:hypothetical protein